MKVIYQNKNTKIILKDNRIIKTGASVDEAKIQQIAHKIGISPEVYKIGTTIEMEYIKGNELDSYLKLPGIDKKQLKRSIRQTLDKMYDNGINHKDLTGKNIMITLDGAIKIIDYGYADIIKEPVPIKLRDYGILRNF